MVKDRRRQTLELIQRMKDEFRGFRLCFKDDPPSSMTVRDRLLHGLARLVSPQYDTRFTTVLYPRIYLPAGARQLFETNPERYYVTLRHEYVHLRDFRRYHLWMALGYVALLPVGWTMRAFWELRGYTQNMICEFEETGGISDETIERLTCIFASRDYFFMALPKQRARRMLLETREQIADGKLAGEYPWNGVV